jgi:hypothetical protein
MGHRNFLTDNSASEAKPENQLGLWTDTSESNNGDSMNVAEPLPENCFGGQAAAPETATEVRAEDAVASHDDHQEEPDEDAILWARLNAQAKPQELDILDVEDEDHENHEEVLALDEHSNKSSILDKISKPAPVAPAVERPSPEPKKNGVNQAFDVNTLMQLQDEAQNLDIFNFVSTTAPVPVQKKKQRQYVIPESDLGYVRPALIAGATTEPVSLAPAELPPESIPASEFVPTISKELMAEQDILRRTFRIDSGAMYKTLGIGSEGAVEGSKPVEEPSAMKDLVKAMRRRRTAPAKAVVITEVMAPENKDAVAEPLMQTSAPESAPQVMVAAPEEAVTPRHAVKRSKTQMRRTPRVAEPVTQGRDRIKTDVARTFTKTGVRVATPASTQPTVRSVHQPVQHVQAAPRFVSSQSSYLSAGASQVRSVGMPGRPLADALSHDDMLRLKISQTVQEVLLMRKMLAHYFEA